MRDRLFVPLTILVTLAASFAVAQQARVEFELVTERGVAAATTQKWFKTLTDLKVASLRIRGETPTDRPKIDVAGAKDRPVFRVTGRINARGVLTLPGGQFSAEEGPRIARWMRQLADSGIEGVTHARSAFDLTKSQLAEVTDDLTRRVSFSTKGTKPIETLQRLLEPLKLKAVLDDEVEHALADDEPVRDELQGFSTGTALAVILRPAGAALVPAKPAGQEVQLGLVAAKNAKEVWPIGWPSEKEPGRLAPKLFEFLNAEIEGVSAAEAIEAVRGRLELPLLFDHNNMALHRIDLTKAVAIPAKRTYYSKVLEQVLFKAGLKYELRVDENDKPFLWVTTLKR